VLLNRESIGELVVGVEKGIVGELDTPRQLFPSRLLSGTTPNLCIRILRPIRSLDGLRSQPAEARNKQDEGNNDESHATFPW
jgi:hypothetical protein